MLQLKRGKRADISYTPTVERPALEAMRRDGYMVTRIVVAAHDAAYKRWKGQRNG